MKFDRLAILLPCQSLEDFSLGREADEAGQLLSAWSALWHPTLVSVAQDVPTWFPADQPPQAAAGHLVVIPDCSRGLVPTDWPAEAESAGAGIIRDLQHRDQIIAAALEPLDTPRADASPDLAADFLALGFCHLIVELLTRQLRYMSNLNEESFKAAVVRGAEEATVGNAEAAREQLQSAFDLLHEAREYFYPVESHLLDLTLVAATTLGESLRAELAGGAPSNLLISAELIERIAVEDPATLAALDAALKRGSAALVGGEYAEQPLPLLPPEAIRYHLLKGLDAYQRRLGRRPTIFGRRCFGLSPVLPQILRKLGFAGAVHCTLDDGRFPKGNQSRIQWEGLDGTVLEALARLPADIGRADAFLRLPERLGNSMDLDHAATMVLAHWPGQSSPWYEDLRRIAAYSSVLGTFATIDDYFEQTGLSGQRTQYRADQYRSPYLRQATQRGQSDPISRWVRYFSRRAGVEAMRALETLSTLVASASVPCSQADELLANVEDVRAADNDPESDPDAESNSDTKGELDRLVEGRLCEAVGRFAQTLAGPGQSEEKGYLVANPWSFSRRLCVEVPDLRFPPNAEGAVRAVGQQKAVVDVPAMGFAWIGPGSAAAEPAAAEPAEPLTARGRRPKKRGKEDPPLAEENVLRNEFVEVTIDPHTGSIRSIKDYHSRGSRLAQQVAMRLAPAGRHDDGDDSGYSIMAADRLDVTSSGPILGEIVARGRLVDRQGRPVARFSQATRLWRGSRVVELLIDLDVERLPGPDPWNSYYAARFAWGDATANLYRSVSLANVPSDAVQLEAPHFVDVRAGKLRTTILTGGLPWHRRFGLRKLDTLLVVRGETARRFRLGIGIDLPHPMPAALGFLAPQTVLPGVRCPSAVSGWLFHLDRRDVIVTHWEPLLTADRVGGFRARLLETDGHRVEVALRCFRPVRSAEKINSGDTPPTELPVHGDQVTMTMGPHEWIEVAGRFA